MKFDGLHGEASRLTIREAIEDFLLHQRVCRHSPRTIENHAYSLAKLQSWATSKEITHLVQFDAHTLRQFFLDLQESPIPSGGKMKSSTLFTVHKNVKVFFRFQHDEGNIENDPMRRLKPPKIELEVLPPFTPREIKTLEAATSGRDFLSLRNRALIYFMLDSGCRLAEASAIKLQDIDMSSGIVRIRKGKGGKERATRVGATTLRALAKYIRSRPSQSPENLWIGCRGAMTADGISITLEKLGKGCGVHCHAHKFRRTTALTMLRNGCDIYSIKSLLGHSDLQVLQRYLAQTESDIARAHERFGPVDNLR